MMYSLLSRVFPPLRSAAFALAGSALLLAGCVENSANQPPVTKQETQASAPAPQKVEVVPAPAPSPAPAEKVTLTPPEGAEIRVGVLLPMSGQYAALGKSLLNAVQLGLFEVAEENLVLLPRDTMGTAAGARQAARSAIDSGAQFLIGPVFSEAASAVADLKAGQGVVSLAFTNNRAAAGAEAYIVGLVPRQRIERVVSYAASRGLKRFAGLLPAGAYGDLIRAAYQDAVLRVGGELTRMERYVPGEQAGVAQSVKRLGDYDERKKALEDQKAELAGKEDPLSLRALKRLEELETLGDVDFDAVLLIENGQALTALAPLLPYYEIDTRTVRILGISDWGERSLLREPALQGAWYAAPSLRARADFEDRYRALYGKSPHPLAPLAYDAGAIAAVLGAQKPPAFSSAALTDPRGFAGSIGLFRFRKDGLVEHNFAVIEVQPGGAVEVSPAPEKFPAPVVN